MSMPSPGPPEPDLHPRTSRSPVRSPPRHRGSDRAAMILEASAMRVDGLEPADGSQPGTAPEPEPEPLPPRTGWTLISLIPHDAKEPRADLADNLAQATWCAVSALWHPSLLARAAELPRSSRSRPPPRRGPGRSASSRQGRSIGSPPVTAPRPRTPGAVVLESGTDRAALIRQIQERLGAVGTPETSDDAAMISAADDFLALGTTRWMLRDLAIAMGHEGAINHQALTREVLAGADAWQGCDRSTAVNRLRAGFEVLTQARERFYPVDAYLIDLCLLDPAMPAGVLAGPARGSRGDLVPGPGPGDREPGQARPGRHGLAPPGDHRGLGRRRRRALRRGRRPGPARSSRSSGSSATGARSTAPTSRSGTSRPTPGGGSGSTRSFPRSPSGSGSGSRFTWDSTPAGSRSGPRPSGSGRAPTAPASRRCCARPWRPIGRPRD